MPKNQFLSQAESFLKERYGKDLGEKIYSTASKRFEEICKENENEPKAMHSHTRAKIYPATAIFEAQMKHGVVRQVAISFIMEFCKNRSENYAKIVRKIMKIPGIYKKMPMTFGKMTKKKFGVNQNFEQTFHELSPKEMRFDMTKCPYADIFTKYDCPELTVAFCRGDDIVYGNMHPKLKWYRTKTIGDGDNCCNFKITVVE